MIKVLIVDDSPVTREYLRHIFSADPMIQVVGTVQNGAEALAFVRRIKPDVITMDIVMPALNGYDTTRSIMETEPVPIIMVSGSSEPNQVTRTFRAMEAGAVAVIEKPPGIGHPGAETAAAKLVEMVKLMATIKLVTRRPRHAASPGAPIPPPPWTDVRLVAIGASTGGPQVLHTILSELPKDLGVPLLIVQHIAPGFLPGLVQWLAQTTGFPTHIAVHKEVPRPGHAYLAPDEKHMGVGDDGRILLSTAVPEGGLRPAISYLFRAVTRVCGAQAIGVLLTGMGTDGVAELQTMRERGAITMVQDRQTAVVYGMPGAAVQRRAALYVLSPGEIVRQLCRLIPTRDAVSMHAGLKGVK